MSTPLPDWTTRDSFRRDPHQRHIARTNELSNLTPPAGGEVLRTPFGTGVSVPPPLKTGTDYSVYIDAIAAGTDMGGIYTGYCFRSQPPTTPTNGLACQIKVDDEIKSKPAGVTFSQQHWSLIGSYGVGRFNGEYTTDTPPKPIIHATGFAVNVNAGAGVLQTLSFGNQIWQRDLTYADPTNPANGATGDMPIKMSLCTRQDAATGICVFRSFHWDASGRLHFIDHEGT